jgi:hypothetical protein
MYSANAPGKSLPKHSPCKKPATRASGLMPARAASPWVVWVPTLVPRALMTPAKSLPMTRPVELRGGRCRGHRRGWGLCGGRG